MVNLEFGKLVEDNRAGTAQAHLEVFGMVPLILCNGLWISAFFLVGESENDFFGS